MESLKSHDQLTHAVELVSIHVFLICAVIVHSNSCKLKDQYFDLFIFSQLFALLIFVIVLCFLMLIF